MALVTSGDARRVAGLMRAEYDRLDRYLGGLSPDDWVGPSFSSDWKVYQVVSHLGSGPEIANGMLRQALLGGPEMADEQLKGVWARFDSLPPEAIHAAHRATNEALFATLASLDEQQLAAEVPWFAGGTVPLAKLLTARLNEQTLHTWDIVVMQEPGAKLTADNVADLLELNLSRLDMLARPERARALGGEMIQFDLSEPPGTVSLSFKEDLPPGVTLAPLPNPGLKVSTATETFVRLVWGRYREPAAPARLELDRPDLKAQLIAAFPGR